MYTLSINAHFERLCVFLGDNFHVSIPNFLTW